MSKDWKPVWRMISLLIIVYNLTLIYTEQFTLTLVLGGLVMIFLIGLQLWFGITLITHVHNQEVMKASIQKKDVDVRYAKAIENMQE